MAATSPPQPGQPFAQRDDDGSYGHKKNSSSQDSRQNFSYPNAYSQSPPQPSPRSPDEFITPSSVFPGESGASGFNFGDNGYSQPTDRAANRFDSSRAKSPAEPSRYSSYGESLNDMYRSQKAPHSGATTSKDNKKSGPNRLQGPELDKSNWIHRDKLTQIEIQEHLALGKKIPPELLAKVQERQHSSYSRTHRPAPSQESSGDHYNENKKPRIYSPSPEAEQYAEYDDEDDEPFVPIDPRSPEEIAADLEAPDAMYQHMRLRSSSSRIPLATISPLPVPQEHLDRNTRIPRKRSASGTHDPDSIAYPKSRSRSHSVGSQVLLDEDGDGSPDMPGSPVKSKTPSKATPTGRKGSSTVRSTSATAPKRNTSTAKNSPVARPSTRDGRPPTSNSKPEGEPPWLSSMYKPDPRLPPDQQMLPTHAKRMMQEQWEKEGKPGQTYDREFRPLALYPEGDHPPRSQSPPVLQQDDAQQGRWPLQRETSTPEMQQARFSPAPTQGSQRGQQSPQRHQGNGEAHGGYSTMPKVQGTPVLGATSPRPDQRERFDVEEQKEKDTDGGCKCCIVM